MAKTTKKKSAPDAAPETERCKLIQKIEEARQTRVICYLTSIRPNLETEMAIDAIRKIYEHLQKMKNKAIDLFLVSNGGDGTVPWRLVTLIREYAK